MKFVKDKALSKIHAWANSCNLTFITQQYKVTLTSNRANPLPFTFTAIIKIRSSLAIS